MKNTKLITEVAILVALAVVLEVVFTGLAAFFPFLALPYGGRVSLSMLPIFIVTYRHGFRYGIYAGVIYSIMNLLLDGAIYHWASVPLDYLIAFGSLGLGYIGVLLLGKNFKGFALMVVIGSFFRFLSSFISGIILVTANPTWLPGEFTAIAPYSAVYNAYYMVPSAILIIIVGYFLMKRINVEGDLF
ncbi:Thiamine transporter ThiT [Candidatus Izimaplasma bacterium HR1]|jgi:thiamine transporter|uniref:energy-coupled thiamine transporter ThiT n=1 Tax=Candidatus Izimoplasma sp. HR1 TaxID=1541959 RepID=UPI0004F62B88|nr:Thiamine transporter ThiT [Candidatus Izimaplasma bacterium HR1]